MFVEDWIQTGWFGGPLLCGMLSQIPMEGYEKLSLVNLAEYAMLGGSPILLGLINRDKNGVEDLTFALSGRLIDDFSIDNKGA